MMRKTITLFAVAVSTQLHAQIFDIGMKAGYVLAWTRHDDRFTDYDDLYRITPVSGFNAGATAIFKLKKKFFLQTDFLFTTKGRRINGRVDKILNDRSVYYHIDIPVLYNVQFDGKVKLKKVKYFKWYAGIGPNFSYWLGGSGRVANTEFVENEYPALRYTIRFGERGDDVNPTNIYQNNVKRFQLGVQLGGGILLEPINGKKIMIDARFELGHTWIGKENSADYIIPIDYQSARNMKDRNNNLRFSVMYLWEHNLDKKARKKGKSTIRKRRL